MYSLYTYRSHAGFTLVEAMIVVAIVAILAGGVIPGFSYLISDTRLTNRVNDFLHSLHYTRSEAIKRQQHVILCPTRDQSNCLSQNDWSDGWMVYVDQNRNQRRDTVEPILLIHAAIDPIQLHSGKNRHRVRYRADGLSYGTNTTFIFCDNSNRVKPQAIILSNPGRARASDTGPGGKPLKCP